MTSKEGKPLTTYELVTLAVYLLGGEQKWIDTEDVAIKTDELSPGRFRWRKYKDQIDLNNIMISLRDAKRPRSGGLIVGDLDRGWRLTSAGIKSAKRAENLLTNIPKVGKKLDRRTEKWLLNEKRRLLTEPAIHKYVGGAKEQITKEEAAKLFRIDSYSQGARGQDRVEKLCAAFLEDEMVGPALIYVKSILMENKNE